MGLGTPLGPTFWKRADLSKAGSDWPEALSYFVLTPLSSPELLVPLPVSSGLVRERPTGSGYPGKTLFCTELPPEAQGTGLLIVILDSLSRRGPFLFRKMGNSHPGQCKSYTR